MSDDIPDWIKQLGIEESEEEGAGPLTKSEPAAPAPEAPRALPVVARPATPALEARPVPRRRRPSSPLGGLRAWQRFVLSVFLFLDVTVVGGLFLVMLGRMALP